MTTPSHQTVVATSQAFVHYNPYIFPDPHTFKPERWLGGNQDPNVYSLDIAFGFGRRYELCNFAYVCAQV